MTSMDTALLLLLAITAGTCTAMTTQAVTPEPELPTSQDGRIMMDEVCKMECRNLRCRDSVTPPDNSAHCICLKCEIFEERKVEGEEDRVKMNFIDDKELNSTVDDRKLKWIPVQPETMDMTAKNATCNTECGYLQCGYFITKSDKDVCACGGCDRETDSLGSEEKKEEEEEEEEQEQQQQDVEEESNGREKHRHRRGIYYVAVPVYYQSRTCTRRGWGRLHCYHNLRVHYYAQRRYY